MALWFTRPGAPVEQSWVKRFAAQDWTVDFPRGTMASTVTTADERGVTVEAHFLRKGDLVGLIYESEDRHSHPARARETRRDYTHCQLSFRWKSTGLIVLNAVKGPTLTIEGRDAAGDPKSWYVRLWNYASGSPIDAVVTLDFDDLDGGYLLPAEADPVYPKDIDRMFFSLVPPAYVAGSVEPLGAATSARLEISELSCNGSGSVIAVGDAWAPEHPYGAATAYDDMYNLAPERVVRAVEAAGFRGTINHYVGMSHYPALRGRRATEWATIVHAVGDAFCLIDTAALRRFEISASAAGATLTGTAYGIGDVAPFPNAARKLSGESLRPPSPCHLSLWREGTDILAQWVRRSHRGWTWTDGIGVADDPFPELYRLTVSGPSGELVVETSACSASFSAAALPALPGQSIALSVVMVGPMRLSREASASLIL